MREQLRNLRAHRLRACLPVLIAALVGGLIATSGCESKQAANPASHGGNSATGPSKGQSADRPPADSQTANLAASAPQETGRVPAAGKGDPLSVRLPFDGWPKPQFALVLTGQQLGYIEPCGCTGLENQKGGLARRHTLIKQLAEERGWDVVSLDVGSQVKRFGKQSEVKFAHTAKGLRTMGYQGIVLGADDLRLSAGDLLAATNPDEKTSLFVSANVALLARDLQPQFVVAEPGGKKIGVTAVLGERYRQRLQGDELVHEEAVPALEKVAAQLKQQGCDYLVLLVHAPLDEAREIAQKVPGFDLVVAPGETPVASHELETLPESKTRFMQIGTKAMYAGVVGVFEDAQNPVRYESVPLDGKLADSPQMLNLLAEYQKELEAMGFEGLGLKPQPHPTGREFVGSETCGECHTKAYAKWSTTPHAHATESLVHPPNSRGEIARHYDPECLSCHVTGWEPQKFFPYLTGYLSLEETPKLQHNGCENCHGPGSAHVVAENGEGSDEDRLKLREAMKLPLAGSMAERKCLECHDDNNSPDFHLPGAFEKYWREVEHRGKD